MERFFERVLDRFLKKKNVKKTSKKCPETPVFPEFWNHVSMKKWSNSPGEKWGVLQTGRVCRFIKPNGGQNTSTVLLNDRKSPDMLEVGDANDQVDPMSPQIES